MNSKTLVNALKVAVREVIKEELTDILREGLQSTVTELQTETKQPFNNGGVEKSKKRKETMYTRNKFADVLNDTAVLREQGSYAELMKEGMPEMSFTSDDSQGFGMMRNNSTPEIIADPETGKNMKVDPTIAKAMTRDYSELLKAIDKKQGR
tara:strand:+ start:601 stop:1056 length:456 start_codon:yes stop_codon:yes gene_type:complete